MLMIFYFIFKIYIASALERGSERARYKIVSQRNINRKKKLTIQFIKIPLMWRDIQTNNSIDAPFILIAITSNLSTLQLLCVLWLDFVCVCVCVCFRLKNNSNNSNCIVAVAAAIMAQKKKQ